MTGLELVVASRYGMHRDELYFLECARHLSWGYVDQPPLVPAVARLVLALFGPSVFWLRFLSALAGGGTVVMTGLTARQLGGGRQAQIIGAVAAACSAQTLATFHLLSTAAFDIFFWSAIIYLLTRLLTSEDPRWWLAVGAAFGAALLNKLNVGYLAIGALAGLLVCRRWSLLRSKWLAAGAAVAAVIAIPDVAWNATHHWAQVSMLQSLHRENSTLGASLGFIPSQLIVVGPVLAWVWLPGLKRLHRHPAGRPLAVAYLVLLVLYALAGAKSYYLAGMYYALFAAGGLYVEERLAGRSGSPRPGALRNWMAAMACAAVVGLPLTLPVLPQSALATGPWESSINKDLSATVGWPAFTRQIGDIAAGLPEKERDRLVIYTGDYGAAGAIDLYGPADHLPPAISGHNNFWWWGPAGAPNQSTTIAIDLPRSYLLTMFRQVEPAGVVSTPGNVWTEERADPIWICTGQTETWAHAWPGARHYD
jgi:4-amino-4-deoxy-L-arabinose transferase-like glycosyltransferase